MKKHFLILSLVLCLALTAFAACTQTPDEPSAETETGAEATTMAETAAEETSEPATTAEETTVAETAAEETTEAETTAEETTEPETEEPTEPETTAEETTEAETEEPTEPETHAPRYDYFEADVKADVTVDASVYTDMQLTLPSYLLVTDEEIQAYIDYILFQYRSADNGTTQVTDQPMKLGDDAYIYYKGVMDGVEFEGGSNWDDTKPYQLGLGSGTFIPGFEDGLVGVIPANATKDNPAEVHVTFPEEYGAAELAGKDAVFYVAVEYAVQYTIPAYTRDTVENTLKFEGTKEIYVSDAAFLAHFETFVKELLEEDAAADEEYEKLNALWTYLTEQIACTNFPQLELDYYYNAYMEELEYYYSYYKSFGGASFAETYPDLDAFAKDYMGVGEDGDWKAELTKLSTDMVKKDMITHAIAELEGMETITEEEFDKELQYWVDSYQGYLTKEEILANMGEENIREGALAAKMQEWLMEHVTFTYAD